MCTQITWKIISIKGKSIFEYVVKFRWSLLATWALAQNINPITINRSRFDDDDDHNNNAHIGNPSNGIVF